MHRGKHLRANPETPTGTRILKKKPKTFYFGIRHFSTVMFFFTCHDAKELGFYEGKLKKEKTYNTLKNCIGKVKSYCATVGDCDSRQK